MTLNGLLLKVATPFLTGGYVPTAEVGVPETLKVDGSFCSDAYKTMQIFLGNVF